MPLNSEGPPTNSRQEFCLALKAARERKGITLAEIANTTKVPAFLFAALERHDLRRWPKGLFRRSFFRDYARMIGVPVAGTCAEFVRLFPDDEGAAAPKAAGTASEADQADEVRLVFDAAWHGPRAPVLLRLLAVLIDAVAVILMAAAIAWVAGVDQSATIATVALAYFSLATAWLGESPAKWAASRRHSILDALMRGRLALEAAFRPTDGGEPGPVEEPETRTWISDARRVGPPASPGLRVRIKLSQ